MNVLSSIVRFLVLKEIKHTTFVDQARRNLYRILGTRVNLMGGYCWHFAVLLFHYMKQHGMNVEFICDGGHIAVYDVENDVSYDARGEHPMHDALDERPKFLWKKISSVVKFLKQGFATNEQISDMSMILHHVQNGVSL